MIDLALIRPKMVALLAEYSQVQDLMYAIHARGGRILLVGGAVRDLLLGLPVKDLDIEVHGIPLEQLEEILKTAGPVSLIGKSFGVLRVHTINADWSLPRADASGRKPEVSVDPSMDIKQAFARRDLTINAIGIDMMTYELIDPFNGCDDLAQGILRAIDPVFFVEDPLRFYRVMQFIGRFAMAPHTTLNEICAAMDISQISIERIEAEFEKLLLKSWSPSKGIRWLREIGRLQEVLPEVAATIGVPQDPRWHPEGDVFEHSMQALDAAARTEYESLPIKLIITYAALCHDLGKVTTTQKTEHGYISYGHELDSEEFAKLLLRRITRKKDLVETVMLLVRHHMQPMHLVAGNAKLSAYKRLARKLAPHATLEMLASLSRSDSRGRNPGTHEPLAESDPKIEQFVEMAQVADVLDHVGQPVLLGRDLMGLVRPGPEMGALLRKAYTIQIEESITDKQLLKERVLSMSNDEKESTHDDQ
jgi:tRNA nucleotidyltransferase (CCA-adding enzyme)